jgi:hypothetical protein
MNEFTHLTLDKLIHILFSFTYFGIRSFFAKEKKTFTYTIYNFFLFLQFQLFAYEAIFCFFTIFINAMLKVVQNK